MAGEGPGTGVEGSDDSLEETGRTVWRARDDSWEKQCGKARRSGNPKDDLRDPDDGLEGPDGNLKKTRKTVWKAVSP